MILASLTLLDHSNTPGAAILSTIFPHRRKDRVYGLQPPSLSKKITQLLNLNHGQHALFAGWSTGVHGDLGRYTELAFKPWDGMLPQVSGSPIACSQCHRYIPNQDKTRDPDGEGGQPAYPVGSTIPVL
jgi:hypothetical protein